MVDEGRYVYIASALIKFEFVALAFEQAFDIGLVAIKVVGFFEVAAGFILLAENGALDSVALACRGRLTGLPTRDADGSKDTTTTTTTTTTNCSGVNSCSSSTTTSTTNNHTNPDGSAGGQSSTCKGSDCPDGNGQTQQDREEEQEEEEESESAVGLFGDLNLGGLVGHLRAGCFRLAAIGADTPER